MKNQDCRGGGLSDVLWSVQWRYRAFGCHGDDSHCIMDPMKTYLGPAHVLCKVLSMRTGQDTNPQVSPLQ